MKKLFYISLVLSFFFASCSKEAGNGLTETVVVNLSPEIPGMMATRAVNDLTVNKLVCAVFEKGEEVEALRKTIDITDPTMISYTPRLVKGRTYNVVFWAMKDGNYDVTDLTAIVRSSTGSSDEADYDAFTVTTNITVESSETIAVTLTRPLAQLNIGVTKEDWNAVVALGQTPGSTSISYESYDAFNALTGGLLMRNYGIITRTDDAPREELRVAENTYISLGSFFVLLPETQEQTLDIMFTILDTDDQSIREDVFIPHIPVQRNHKTNVVGGLLTGTVNYQVTISDDFSNTEHNKVP